MGVLLLSAAELETKRDSLSGMDEPSVQAGLARQASLTKPAGSLGMLEQLAVQFCGWQKTARPSADRAQTLVFAGNHGVVAQGVSAFPAEVTKQMVGNFAAGGAAINQLCKAIPSELCVIPLGLDTPTGDITKGPAMSEEEALAAFNEGAAAVSPDSHVIVVGEMGIGNTTIAAALCHGLFGGEAFHWVGGGTGVDQDGLKRKQEAVAKAVALHGSPKEPIALLAALGGRELAAMAGAVAAARIYSIPVLLDGYVVTAAAATLTLSSRDWLSHCIAGHVSMEPGHGRLMAKLGLHPLLSLGMRLGEGSGAQLALALVRAALATHNGMATFEEAMVAAKSAG